MNTNLPPILKIDEVAKILRISKDTAYKISKQQGFPKLPVQKPILIPRDKFLKWAGLA